MPSGMFFPSSGFLADHSRGAVLLLWVLLVACVSCHAVFLCSLWRCGSLLGEGAGLLAHLCVVFSSAFVAFPYGVVCQMCYLIVWILDLCLLHYIEEYIQTISTEGPKSVYEYYQEMSYSHTADILMAP